MLNLLGVHQPGVWHRSRFRSAASVSMSLGRLRRRHSGIGEAHDSASDSERSTGAPADDLPIAKPRGSAQSSPAQHGDRGEEDAEGDEVDSPDIDAAAASPALVVAPANMASLAERQANKRIAKRRLERSHHEERSRIIDVLRALDAGFLERGPGSTELSRKGIIFVTVCSTAAFHFLRLLLRDALLDVVLTRTRDAKSAMMKRRITEVYLLSTLHSITCATYSLRRILGGRWDTPQGAEGILCFSLGYTTYSLLTLRRHVLWDPMFAINEVANFVKMTSVMRSRGVRWMVPLLMSAEAPLACLNVLRMMMELGVTSESRLWRLALGAFTTSFATIKGAVLPAAIYHLVVRRAKEYPELHQPSFLPAKLALFVRILLNYTWLSIMARHWWPLRRRRAAGAVAVAGAQREDLPSLNELSSSMRVAWEALLSASNPLGVIYFVALQSFYFIAPAAVPAALWALVRAPRPRVRLSAGGVLAALGLLTFWPMKVDQPFHKKPLNRPEFNLLGRMVTSYFSFKSVYEEPLQTDRRYLVAVLPHGVMPFAMNCLSAELMEKGWLPNMAGASILLKVPILRQLCRWGGVIPAEESVIKQALQWPHPHNVTFIVPGGIAEMFFMRPDIEQVYVKTRKGFVKLALEAGVDLVPAYGLGHTQLFTTLDRSSRLGSLLMNLSRRLRISLPLSHGRWGMPLVPYPRPVVALVGRPIRIDHPIPNPTDAQIDEVHDRFVAEVRRIFDKHKHLVPGYENKRLYFEDEAVPARKKDGVVSDPLFPSTMPLPPSKL